MSAGEEGEFVDEETGWKLIHGEEEFATDRYLACHFDSLYVHITIGDVFRPPESSMLLSACVGVGVHILVTMTLVVTLAICNIFDPTRRGSVLQASHITLNLILLEGCRSKLLAVFL